jgi:hypothetical protein
MQRRKYYTSAHRDRLITERPSSHRTYGSRIRRFGWSKQRQIEDRNPYVQLGVEEHAAIGISAAAA